MLSVLEKITPTKEEEKFLKDISNKILEKLNSKIKNAKSILGGSAAKNTYLKGDYDIDIFVKFNQKYKNKNISKLLEKDLKKIFKNITKIHGSRDYFQVKQPPFIFEIVPILNIKNPSNAVNITDVSPFHTKWVKKRTNKNLINEIRLTKSFCKANKLYGAESYIKGFSGYVLEILTIYYKSFQNLIKAATKWQPKTIIDIEKHKTKLNKSKLSPLIVIDPVQPDRNAAAALSQQKFNEFISLAKSFLYNPSPSYFTKKSIDIEALKGAVILKVFPLKGKEDVIGSKLLKVLSYIAKKLNEEGFLVKKYDWQWNGKNEALLWYFPKIKGLSLIKKHFGPPIKEIEHVKVFKEKYKSFKLKEQENRIYVELKRKHPTIKPFIKNLLKDSYIKEKVKKIILIQ